MTRPLQQTGTPPMPAPADPVVDPTTIPHSCRHLIPRFDALVWPLTFTSDNPSVAEVQIHWATFPAALREQFRVAAWALLNFPVPDQMLTRQGVAMRSRLSTLRLYHTITDWRTFATWLDSRGITALAEVSTQVLIDYSIYLARIRKVSRNTAINHLVALTRLYIYAPRLPITLRIGVPPWQTEGLDDYLPAATTLGENATEPISPATMGPLLVWALKFVEEFAVDILAAQKEHQRLREVIERHHNQLLPPGRPAALTAYLKDLKAHGKPLPTLSKPMSGQQHPAAVYIAAIVDCHPKKVHQVLRQKGWRRYLVEHPGPCPLNVPITGMIDGGPWTAAVAFDQVGSLVRHLTTACFIVIAYLTGMRASEVLALDVGCCPDPEPRDMGVQASSARRHLIRGRQFKTARDDEGNHLSSGVLREAPWLAVPQVVAAIRVLESLVEPASLLFPTDRGSRTGRSLSFGAMASRIEEFIAWVNDRTARPGEDESIPPDPHGHIGTARFRRTLAWHIARRPGGLVALAIQYGHLRTLVSEGYSSRQRGGIHDMLDLETARAVAEHLSEVHDALHHGEGVSGPAARRLLQAAQEQHHRFGGIIATPRQAKALLSDPALTVFENADAYLICNYDPHKAPCNPNAESSRRASAPSLDRCQATCPNIARTDTQARQLRALAERLCNEAASPLTPQPLADRLRNHMTALIDLANKHDRTRIVLTDEEPA